MQDRQVVQNDTNERQVEGGDLLLYRTFQQSRVVLMRQHECMHSADGETLQT